MPIHFTVLFPPVSQAWNLVISVAWPCSFLGSRGFVKKLRQPALTALGYGEYYRRAERLAAHFVGLGLGADDVVAIQLPNWSEFAVAVNAAMLAGVPFCQFHSDFRSREVEFILRFTGASALIVPSRFRRFDYLDMLGALRPKLPLLRHLMVVGDEFAARIFRSARLCRRPDRTGHRS